MRFKVLGPLEVERDDGPRADRGTTAARVPDRPADAAERGHRHRAARRRDLGGGPAGGAGQRPAASGDPTARAARRRGELSGHRARRLPAIVAPGALDADRFESGYRRARRMRDAEPDAACGSWRRSWRCGEGRRTASSRPAFAQAPSVRLAELRTAAAEDRVRAADPHRCGHRRRSRRPRAGRRRTPAGTPRRAADAGAARVRKGGRRPGGLSARTGSCWPTSSVWTPPRACASWRRGSSRTTYQDRPGRSSTEGPRR